jgi:hypothetical protein
MSSALQGLRSPARRSRDGGGAHGLRGRTALRLQAPRKQRALAKRRSPRRIAKRHRRLRSFQHRSRIAARGAPRTAAPRATTELIASFEGTEVVHHAESEPPFWLPPLIGPAIIESETRTRFEELRAEILRRKAVATIELK